MVGIYNNYYMILTSITGVINIILTSILAGVGNDIQIKRFQPAIIKLIRLASKGAHDAGIFCGICGEIAENELYYIRGINYDQSPVNIIVFYRIGCSSLSGKSIVAFASN